MTDNAFAAPTRRSLIKGALVLAFALPVAAGRLKAASLVEAGTGPASPWQPNGFVQIDATGITLIIPNVEMGQGIYTAEAMLLAEELEIDLDQFVLVPAPPNPAIYTTVLLQFQGTGGSTSVRSWWEPLRKAAAAARTMLVSAAASRWKVDPSACRPERGRVLHDATGQSLAYTELAADASELPVPTDVPLKDPANFRLVGKTQKRIDTPAKVNGSAKFGIDIRIPRMKVATVIASPVFGGKVKSVDDAGALAIPGVLQVLKIADAVAVVADNTWTAIKASRLLRIDWEDGANATMTTASIRDQLINGSLLGNPIVALDQGDVIPTIAKSSRSLDAVYELPFLAHATMEPINTIVHVHSDGCDIWCGTQVPDTGRGLAAKVTGLPPEKVRVHNQLIGGGFGRRLEADSIGQAAAFAMQVDYPLQVVWTREEDIRHDYYRPAYHDRMSASLDKDGMPEAMWHRTTGGSVLARYAPAAMPPSGLDSDAVEGSLVIPYAIPKRAVEWVRDDPPENVPFSWWRGVGPTHNVFVVETFIDELAHLAGADPVQFRRRMLTDNPRALAVLDLAAEMSDWEQRLPGRSGRGVSLHQSFGSFCALVVEIEVSPEGIITMKKATAAIDCGHTVNPDTVIAQIEGGAIFGLSAALYSGIEFENGRTVQSNFHDYRILRIDEAPRLEVHHIRNTEKPGGIGEVGTVSAAPALGNAIFAATGIRLRNLPFDRPSLSLLEADKNVVGPTVLMDVLGLGLAARTTESMASGQGDAQ